jgi:uncharacterized protein YacL
MEGHQNGNEMNTLKLGWVIAAAFGLFLLLMIGLLVANVIYPIHFAELVLFAAILAMVVNASLMVKTGRVKAKGAKKRRARLLPLIYKKKKKANMK